MKINVAPLLKQPVGAQTDYQVTESPIDPRGENAGLLDAGVSSVDADILATHTNPGAYLEGDAKASVALQCSRCLRPIETPVQAHFAEQYYSTIDVVSGGPKAEPPRDAKIIGSDFWIDLTPLLREELILATPLAPLCRPDCNGLCDVCGRDLNTDPHEHEAAVDERVSKLSQLKDFHPDR
ncbi:MAG TPA: DUF177 domain-containing protein [Candidatus Limnocylindria bacterium]|nr:DUF177 domain-containing protein [Candidatus Limnocylindria bacterium]